VDVARTHSRAVEDYLKAIFKLQEGDGSVSTTALAGALDRSAASVTNMVKALAEQGLLEHAPYRGVRLTERGKTAALGIIRRHRVIETYLIDRLGYTWDGVHAEAERLEHAASDDLVERMARALGNPLEDPHGAPIPSPDGVIEDRKLVCLADLPEGAPAVIRRVSDADSDRLRRLAAGGFLLGTEIEVTGAASGGGLEVRVGGADRTVDASTALVIRVERTDTTPRDD
jgi:DtxR family Mn-dependent transcriptional regulator